MQAKFDHFNINVLNLERSMAFYKEALGLEKWGEIEGPEGAFKIIYLKNEASDFKLELTCCATIPSLTTSANASFTSACVCPATTRPHVPFTSRWVACATKTPT